MANDFSGDATCKALWRFENGALTTDSKGTNTLTPAGDPSADLVNFKEGSAAVDLDGNDRLYITDGNLDSGFPLKSGESNKTFSVCGWYRATSFAATPTFFSKAGGGSQSMWVVLTDTGDLYFYVWNTEWRAAIFPTNLVVNIWYHISCTYDVIDNSYRISIWDDDAGAPLDADETGTFAGGVIGTGGAEVVIGATATPTNYHTGQIDETVVFDEVLTVGKIAEIRQGIFAAPADDEGLMFSSDF